MKKIRISALVFGVIAGAIGVMAQVLWSIQPPQAYGLCMVCHAKDFINVLLNNFDWYDGAIAAVAKKGLMLTSITVPLGAFIAAVISKEFRLHFVENKYAAFFLGMGVMICGLIISGCPMRLMLRVSYGDVSGLVMLAFMVAGIGLGTAILKRRAQKQ